MGTRHSVYRVVIKDTVNDADPTERFDSNAQIERHIDMVLTQRMFTYLDLVCVEVLDDDPDHEAIE